MSVPLALEVIGLGVRHGGLLAVDDVTLDVAAGEVVGLIGPNGAGKTTLIDAVAGFTPPTAGRVVLDGADVTGLAPHARARRGMARTFQSLELFEDLTVRENLDVAASTPTWRTTVLDALWPWTVAADTTDRVLAEVGLVGRADDLPEELSHAQRHLVAVGRALVARPRVLLLDEPAAGLDRAETEALGELVARLPGLGTAVVLVDHDMDLVFGVCHRVLVLDRGRLVASGTPAEVRADPTVVAAYLGGPEPEPEPGAVS